MVGKFMKLLRNFYVVKNKSTLNTISKLFDHFFVHKQTVSEHDNVSSFVNLSLDVLELKFIDDKIETQMAASENHCNRRFEKRERTTQDGKTQKHSSARNDQVVASSQQQSRPRSR